MSYEAVKKIVEENLKTESDATEDDVTNLVQQLDLKKDGMLDKEEIVQVIKQISHETKDDE